MQRLAIATVLGLALMAACNEPAPTATTHAAPAAVEAKPAPGNSKACPPNTTKLGALPVCGKIPADLPTDPNPPNIGGTIVGSWRVKDSHTNVRILSSPYSAGMFWDQSKRTVIQGNGGELLEQGTFPNDGVWASFKYSGETRQAIYAVMHDNDVKVECVAEKETAEKTPPDTAAMFSICKTLLIP